MKKRLSYSNIVKATNIALRKCLGVLFALAIFASCTIESSSNGDLDGYWHLESIDTIRTGGKCDLSHKQLFWGVQHKLLLLNGGSTSFLYRFKQTGDSLILLTPYINGGHEDVEGGGDTPLTEPSGLRQYGIQHLEEHFLKEKLGGSYMVLRTDSFRLNLRRF